MLRKLIEYSPPQTCCSTGNEYLENIEMMNWLAITLRKDVILRSLKVAAIVGTILVATNQGDAIVGGVLTGQLMWKIPMTYLVPYLVSTYASVSAIAKNERR